MLRRRKSYAHGDQNTQQTVSASAQVSMTGAESRGIPEWSYGADSQSLAIYDWDDHGCAKLGSPRHVHSSTMPSYRPALKQDAIGKACRGTDVRPSQSAVDRDRDVPCGTDSESECSILRPRGRNASSTKVEHIKKAMGAQHDNVASQCRDRTTKQLQLEKQDQPAYPERSQKSMRQKKVLISDYDAVTRFFESRLKDMQQLATKKIAKAWIKGICPRKQALFPYQDSSRRRDSEEPNVPEWWPKPEFCSFREPDHIKKEERTYLLIHILRLRPTVAQLKKWHSGVNESTSPQASSRKEDWAPFLQSLAPASIFDDMPDIDGNDRKRDYRGQLLDSLYAVAFMEERYSLTGMYAIEHYRYEEEEKRVKSTAKRSLTDSSDYMIYENDAGTEPKTWSPAPRPSKRVKNSRQNFNTRSTERPLRMRGDGSVVQSAERSGTSVDDFQPQMGLDDFNVLQKPMLDLPHVTRQGSPPVFANDIFHDTIADQIWPPTSSGVWSGQQQSMPGSPVWPRSTLSCSTSTIPSFDTSDSNQILRYDPCLTEFEHSNISSQREYNHNYNSSFHQQNQAQHLQVNTAHVPVPQFEPILSPMGTSSLPFDFPMTPAIQDMLNYTSSSTAPMFSTPALRTYDPSDALAGSQQYRALGHEKPAHRHSIACMAGASGDPPPSSLDQHQNTWTSGTHMAPPGAQYTHGPIGRCNPADFMLHRRSTG